MGTPSSYQPDELRVHGKTTVAELRAHAGPSSGKGHEAERPAKEVELLGWPNSQRAQAHAWPSSLAAIEHKKEEKAEHTPWSSLSSAKLLILDEQLRVGLLSSSRDQLQPMYGSSRTSMSGHARLCRTGAIRRRRAQRCRSQDDVLSMDKAELRLGRTLSRRRTTSPTSFSSFRVRAHGRSWARAYG
ncbi:hypothetical protein Dimus_011860 [Dionaea muscipula]